MGNKPTDKSSTELKIIMAKFIYTVTKIWMTKLITSQEFVEYCNNLLVMKAWIYLRSVGQLIKKQTNYTIIQICAKTLISFLSNPLRFSFLCHLSFLFLFLSDDVKTLFCLTASIKLTSNKNSQVQ